mmetsp:Transcript_56332/g.156938  ORF Transcript_56332/g.156938 Transcript_56332/m.156938 type:complete len:200 (+) Transcript_56332:226-825(+)
MGAPIRRCWRDLRPCLLKPPRKLLDRSPLLVAPVHVCNLALLPDEFEGFLGRPAVLVHEVADDADSAAALAAVAMHVHASAATLVVFDERYGLDDVALLGGKEIWRWELAVRHAEVFSYASGRKHQLPGLVEGEDRADALGSELLEVKGPSRKASKEEAGLDFCPAPPLLPLDSADAAGLEAQPRKRGPARSKRERTKD